MKQITVSTRQFEFSHGRKPRGQGGWAFAIDHAPGQASTQAPVYFHGTYREALKQAKAVAVHTITVLP